MKRYINLIFLHGLFFLYACSGILGKSAASYSWGSFSFLGLYCGSITLLAVYAIGWQRILRYIPLSTAYTHRAVTFFWGLIFGRCFFDESITIGKVIGIAMVMCGLVLFDLERRENDA